MLSSDRRKFIFSIGLLPVALSGCFRPMLAENTSSRSLGGRVSLPFVDDRIDYYMRRALRDRLGEPTDPTWSLSVTSTLSEAGFGVAGDGSVTRIEVAATASWQLLRLDTGALVLKGLERSQSGYNATTSLFATRQAKRDIERRLARDLGEKIARRLQASASRLIS